RRIIRPRPAVEAAIDSLGDAALTRKEGVADMRKPAERIGLQHACHCLVPGLLARISCRHYALSCLETGQALEFRVGHPDGLEQAAHSTAIPAGAPHQP